MAAGQLPILWSKTFDELKHELLHNWTLNYSNNLSHGETMRGWRKWHHSAHGRFSCSRSRCLRTWSSVEAVVLFGYRGQRNIIMRLFGQRCPNCRGDYEQPVFPKAEIENVLRRLFKKIININYSEQNQEDDIDHGNNSFVGEGRGQHRRNLHV
nr:receptor-transporting protein 4-like [Paramormyrops kingsleyae]